MKLRIILEIDDDWKISDVDTVEKLGALIESLAIYKQATGYKELKDSEAVIADALTYFLERRQVCFVDHWRG